MRKIIIDNETLVKAVNKISIVGTEAITIGVNAENKNNDVCMMAICAVSNSQSLTAGLNINSMLPCKTSENEKFSFSVVKEFITAIKTISLSGELFTLTLKESELEIECGTARIDVPFKNDDSVIEFPNATDFLLQATMKRSEFIGAVKRAGYARSEEKTSVTSNVVVIFEESGIRIFTTQGNHMAGIKARFETIKQNEMVEKSIGIPGKVLTDVSNVLDNDDIELYLSNNQLMIKSWNIEKSCGECYFITLTESTLKVALSEALFSEVIKMNNVIMEIQSTITVVRKDFIQALNTALLGNAFSSDVKKGNPFILSVLGDEIKLSSENGKSEAIVKPVSMEGEFERTMFLSEFVLKGLSAAGSDKVVIKLCGASNPMFVETDDADDNWRALILPVRMNK